MASTIRLHPPRILNTHKFHFHCLLCVCVIILNAFFLAWQSPNSCGPEDMPIPLFAAFTIGSDAPTMIGTVTDSTEQAGSVLKHWQQFLMGASLPSVALWVIGAVALPFVAALALCIYRRRSGYCRFPTLFPHRHFLPVNCMQNSSQNLLALFCMGRQKMHGLGILKLLLDL